MPRLSIISGFPGRYITNDGRVWLNSKCRYAVPYFNNCGYLRIYLRRDGIGYNKFLHRLIAEAFIPNPNNKPQVNHKNGVKTDNRIENLEWCTASENIQHGHDKGLYKVRVGEQLKYSKLKEDQVLLIKAMLIKGVYIKTIANYYEVSYNTIFDIAEGRTWTHLGGAVTRPEKVYSDKLKNVKRRTKFSLLGDNNGK